MQFRVGYYLYAILFWCSMLKPFSFLVHRGTVACVMGLVSILIFIIILRLRSCLCMGGKEYWNGRKKNLHQRNCRQKIFGTMTRCNSILTSWMQVERMSSLVNWMNWLTGIANSPGRWLFATSRCGIEFITAAAAHYDLARFGMEVTRNSPRQVDRDGCCRNYC